MSDEWSEVDRPVLLASFELLRGGGSWATWADIANHLGWTGEEARRVPASIGVLAADGLVEGKFTMGSSGPQGWVTMVTGEGRRALNEWPHPNRDLVADLLAALEAQAMRTSEPEEQSKLREVATILGGMGRGILVSVISSWLSGEIPKL